MTLFHSWLHHSFEYRKIIVPFAAHAQRREQREDELGLADVIYHLWQR